MRFEEKIIKLRKQRNLSQEELAEKLNVTRQTISKWELGQSKPDMDKLIEMSKLFEVGVETLTNDEMTLENIKKPATKKDRKFILYILIFILVAASVTLAIRLGLAYEEKQKQKEGFLTNIFNSITSVTDTVQNQINGDLVNDMQNQTNEDLINENVINEFTDTTNSIWESMNGSSDTQDETDKSQFNIKFMHSSGTKAAIFVKSTLDNVITSNKTNKEHTIIVVYGKTKTDDEKKIKNIKKSLDEWGQYEVSVDYDDNGYVNKITIEDI